MHRFAGSNALVTGAESGIGRATAKLLAEEGAAVMGAGLAIDHGRELAAELTARGLRANFVLADVSTMSGADLAVRSAIDALGGLNIVVNNAAVFSFGTVEECSEEEWDRVMAVNVKSVYLVSRAAIPHLRAVGGGSIINVSSIHAMATQDHVAAYAASKAAVVGLSRQMAIDFAKDAIRVNVVVVGGTDTPMARRHLGFLGRREDEARFKGDDRRIARIAHPDEIARAIVFLASAESSFITGAPLIVDGGNLARSSA